MVSLTCSTDSRDGVTLVTARLTGGAVAQRVRATNRLDGPLWPPRRRGVPEAGWDDEGFAGVVPAEETVALGYASPAPPAEPPLEIVERERVDDADVADSTSPADALRELGDPSPPRDAVPIPVDDDPDAATDTGDRADAAAPTPGPTTSKAMPEAVESWFRDVEHRLALAERLTAAESLPAAADAVREAGSLDDAAAVAEAVEDDAAALSALADRAGTLADRADKVDVPVDTFRRIA